MKSLVTGGAGFIGSNLIDELVKMGHDVVVIDNEYSDAHDHFYWNHNTRNYKFDIRDYENTRPLYDGVDYVFHIAAEARIQPAILNPIGAISIEVRLNQNYFEQKDFYDSIADKVVYTGCIDEFFDYKYGELGYRSLKFETDVMQMENYQGCAVINQCDHTKKYSRTVEHKHFERLKTDHTVITREYPIEYKRGMTPYYPINNKDNAEMYDKYRKESKSLTKFIFGGRLAEYKYMDMHIVIESAMNKFRSAQ